MDSYRAGKLAKIGFFGALLLALAFKACGDNARHVLVAIPQQIDEAVEATRFIANDLVAEAIDPELAANAATKIAQIAQSQANGNIDVSTTTVENYLHQVTLHEVFREMNLRRLCDGENPAEPELGPTQLSVGDAFDAKLTEAGFRVPGKRKRDIALSNVNRFRSTLIVCLNRDISRAVANGSSATDVKKLVDNYNQRSNGHTVDVASTVALVEKREELIRSFASSVDDLPAARKIVLAQFSKQAVEEYPDLAQDLAEFLP